MMFNLSVLIRVGVSAGVCYSLESRFFNQELASGGKVAGVTSAIGPVMLWKSVWQVITATSSNFVAHAWGLHSEI